MSGRDTSINCPDCGSPILINMNELIYGKKFICSVCGVTLSLASNSVQEVREALKKFRELKDGINRNKGS